MLMVLVAFASLHFPKGLRNLDQLWELSLPVKTGNPSFALVVKRVGVVEFVEVVGVKLWAGFAFRAGVGMLEWLELVSLEFALRLYRLIFSLGP
jgi:hypothetical protein